MFQLCLQKLYFSQINYKIGDPCFGQGKVYRSEVIPEQIKA